MYSITHWNSSLLSNLENPGKNQILILTKNRCTIEGQFLGDFIGG
jgi:hypothetical protein